MTVIRRSLLVVSVLIILAGLLVPAVHKAIDRGSARSNCGSNLKQIGLAANQYADDARFFPHIASLRSLDGDHTTETAAKAFRTLVFLNYMDQPESMICSSSPDQFAPTTAEARKDIAAFGWLGTIAQIVSRTPLYQAAGAAGDKPLTQMVDLSYGWTRQGLGSNSPHSALLAGDKARMQEVDGVSPEHVENMTGNHPNVILAVSVDAHLEKVLPDEPSTKLTTRRGQAGCIAGVTDPSDGFLGVLPDLAVAPGPPRSPRSPTQTRDWTAVALVVLGVVGLLAAVPKKS